jgi:hypothetical protein
MEVLVSEMRRDKTGQVMIRVRELAQRVNSHWAKLLTALSILSRRVDQRATTGSTSSTPTTRKVTPARRTTTSLRRGLGHHADRRRDVGRHHGGHRGRCSATRTTRASR